MSEIWYRKFLYKSAMPYNYIYIIKNKIKEQNFIGKSLLTDMIWNYNTRTEYLNVYQNKVKY